MRDNPIAAIEAAELESKQILQKAGEQRLSLIREAEERRQQEYSDSISAAQAKSKTILESAEAEITAAGALRASELEVLKAGLIEKAKNNEAAAVRSVIELIGGRPS